jgi:hypothetical protein
LREIPAKPAVLQVNPAVSRQGRAMSSQPGRQHAIEHIHSQPYNLQYPDRIADPHKVPGLVGW